MFELKCKCLSRKKSTEGGFDDEEYTRLLIMLSLRCTDLWNCKDRIGGGMDIIVWNINYNSMKELLWGR